MIKKKLMYYKEKLNNLNFVVKILIKPKDKLYKLAIKLYYNNSSNETKTYKQYNSYYSKKLQIYNHFHNNYKIILIELDLSQ